MKNLFQKFFLLFILPVAFPAILSSQHLPEVIALRNLVLTDSINHTVFQNYYDRWCDEIKDHARGVCAWLMHGDRGDRKGEYAFAWGFDFKGTRDYYFPESDISNYPQWNAVLQSFEFRPPNEPMVDSIREYTDFVVLGYDKMINPQMGEVISVRFPEVKPGMEKDFEEFVTDELNPLFQENVDGAYLYFLKGDRGVLKGKYSMFLVFDTVDRRNSYYPREGEDLSDDARQQWSPADNALNKLNEYLEEGSMDSYTDYVVVY